MHTDGRAKALGALGGKKKSYDPASLKVFEDAENAQNLKDVIARTITEVRNGKMDPRAAAAVSSLGLTFLKAFELSDLAGRLARVELALEATKNGRG